jgi:hypothetical protein
MSRNNSDGERQLKNILYNSDVKKCKVDFIFNKKASETVFNIERNTRGIIIENECIKIKHLLSGTKYEFSSLLKKDNHLKRCFEPALNVRTRNNINTEKGTMTDALQILATKISMSMPNYEKGSIEISDAAAIDDINITPFRLLRRQDGLYEKYGYSSDALIKFKTFLKTLTWGKLTSVEEIHEMVSYFAAKFDVLHPSLTNVDPDTLATDVFRRISFEDEKKTLDNKYDASLSFNVYSKIKEHFFNFTEDDDPNVLYLGEDSKEWKKMSKALSIVSVEEMPVIKRNNKTRKNRRSIIG